jgi:Ras-related protein Rab-32
LSLDPINVGKTSIIKRYVNNFWTENYKSTVGVDFALKVLQRGDTKINLQLWDIAGQERFNTMTRVYYKDAAGAILVYDATSLDSWEAVEHWREDLENKLYTEEPLPIILIGNKIDMVDSRVSTFEAEVEEYAQSRGFPLFKCSAKTGEGIEDAMNALVNVMYERQSNQAPSGGTGGIKIKPQQEHVEEKKDCDC